MAKKKTKKQWRGCDARGEETRTAPHERTALKGRKPGIWVWPGGVHSSKGQGLPKQTNKQGYQYQYCRMGMPVLPGTRQTTRGGDRNGIQVHSGQEGLLCTAGGGVGRGGEGVGAKSKKCEGGLASADQVAVASGGCKRCCGVQGGGREGRCFHCFAWGSLGTSDWTGTNQSNKCCGRLRLLWGMGDTGRWTHVRWGRAGRRGVLCSTAYKRKQPGWMERDGGGTERQRGEGLRRSLSRAWVVGMVAEQAKGASTAGEGSRHFRTRRQPGC